MSKYAPLKRFLQEQDRDQVPMTFAEIEHLLKLPLPPSKRYPAWWSNNPGNNTMTREWLEAGYETESVDTSGEKLVFRRMRRRGFQEPHDTYKTQTDAAARPQRHAVFGCMKGTLMISADVDLTEPADPEWAKAYGIE